MEAHAPEPAPLLWALWMPCDAVRQVPGRLVQDLRAGGDVAFRVSRKRGRVTDVRVLALHREEREAVRAKLLEAIAKGEDEGGHLQDVAEMLLKAKRARDFGGLNDA